MATSFGPAPWKMSLPAQQGNLSPSERLLRRGHIRFAQCMVYPGPFDRVYSEQSRTAQDRPVEGLLAMTEPDESSDNLSENTKAGRGGCPSLDCVTASISCLCLYSYTGVSQPCRSGISPSVRPKNSTWRRSVMGPRRPAPMVTLSIERMGVISAAVPVKKTSSAM
jgi:hypothetical protein